MRSFKYLLVLLPAVTVAQLPNPKLEPAAVKARVEEHLKATAALGKAERIDRYLDLLWDYVLESSPEAATYDGDARSADRWSDLSEAAHQHGKTNFEALLAGLKALDTVGVPATQRVSYALLYRDLTETLEGYRYPGHTLLVTSRSSPHTAWLRVLEIMPRKTVAEVEQMLARLERVPTYLEQATTTLRLGLKAGFTPPQVTLVGTPATVLALMPTDVTQHPAYKPFTELGQGIAPAEQQRLQARARLVLQEKVYAAQQAFHDFLAKEYIPGARKTVGAKFLPNGEAYYRYVVASFTTTRLTPEEIHQLGLREVKRIRAQMDSIRTAVGFKGSFEDFSTYLRTDPQFFFTKPEDLLAGYRDICKRADPELIRQFGRVPRTPYGVRPVPSYDEKVQTTAYYNGGNYRTGQPGYFYANTYDLKSRPKWEMEALSLHEAVPGHHFQIAIADELEGVGDYRRNAWFTAFGEGWALYAESLGPAMGFYKDPYSHYGQLTYEIWRAIRLVLDTGIHYYGWSREQAIDYFKSNSPKTQHDIEVEVDRYISWPGQALAYKIGELKIKELRARAEHTLGDGFDVRAFHDQILGQGALPLDVLEQEFNRWLAAQQAR